MMRNQYWWGLAALAAVSLAILGAALLVGSAGLTPATALRAAFGGGDDFSRMIVQTVRLPRAIAGFAVGSLLALSGVLLQALFRNPLADPLVLGVSGGAAIGALSGMLLGAGVAAMHSYATAGGTLVALAVLLLARGGGATRLLLCGVVFASACGAVLTVLLTLADNGQLRGMVFWLAGDLSWAQRPVLLLIAAGATLVLAFVGGRWLNVLGSGERHSVTVGISPGAARLSVFVLSAALTSIAVIGGGMIGFVGLIAPHLVRLGLHTSDHRVIAPAAALAGGSLLCLADLIGRTVAEPRQLPVGAVMALIGAPVFILMLRQRAR
ncbi:MAG TPA: iron ABC transporter permease [Steroidobacteraceae bacterium]|jgi:iron complex transport system permease protein